MNQMKIAAWRFPASQLVSAEAGTVSMNDINLASHPDLVEHLADWEPVSHQLLAVEGDELVLTVLLRHKVEAPDSPQGL